MYRWALIVLLFLSGCHRAAPVITPEQRYEIPVEPAEHVTPDAGHREQDIIAVITVPTPSVISTPSGTSIIMVDTTVKVYKEKKTMRERIFRKKDEAKTPVSVVTNNPSVIVSYPEVTPWWWYVVGASSSVLTIWVILSRIFDTLSGPLTFIMKLLKMGK